MKNNVFAVLLVNLIALGGLQAGVNPDAPHKPAVPVVGRSYTVGQLKALINSNNPSKNSNFIVPMSGTGVVLDSACWATDSKTGKISNLTGSESVDRAGLTNLINSNQNTIVKLQADSQLIKHLVKDGSLDSTSQAQYAKILLYFTLNGYRFYLNDPHPGHIVRSFGVMRSPAQSIINKWDFTKSF